MKVSCDIVKDLLPLYHDGVCSNDSKAMVEEHLAHCDSCKAELRTMVKELPLTQVKRNLTDAKAVKQLSRKWKKGMLKSLLKGSLITIAIIILVALVLFSFIDVRVIPKP